MQHAQLDRSQERDTQNPSCQFFPVILFAPVLKLLFFRCSFRYFTVCNTKNGAQCKVTIGTIYFVKMPVACGCAQISCVKIVAAIDKQLMYVFAYVLTKALVPMLI